MNPHVKFQQTTANQDPILTPSGAPQKHITDWMNEQGLNTQADLVPKISKAEEGCVALKGSDNSPAAKHDNATKDILRENTEEE